MTFAVVLVYIGGHHAHHNWTPEERRLMLIIFPVIFAIALSAALFVYRSWKNAKRGK